jgi:hypothetical protein
VVTVTLTLTPEAVGVTDEEESAQFAPCGRLPQVKLTGALNPPLATSVKVKFAVPPGSSGCSLGAALMVKPVQLLNRNEPMCVKGTGADFMYSETYQKVQSSEGSMLMLVKSPQWPCPEAGSAEEPSTMVASASIVLSASPARRPA